MEISTSGDKRRPKRKNKNSRFMRNAKGFAKKGIYGRGTHIEDDEYTYFINILDTMKADFEDVEDRINMANNVFEQTLDKEEHLASNQIVSKALESLVGFVEASQLERYFRVFGENLRPICSNRFASHVLQKMLEISFLRAVGQQPDKKELELDEEDKDHEPTVKRVKLDNNQPEQKMNEVQYNLSAEFNQTHRTNCGAFVLRLSKFLLNNLEDFMWDSCANPIMRTALLCLAGVHMPKVAFEKAKGADIAALSRTRYLVPDEWFEVIKEFSRRLQLWPQFPEFPYEELTSALISVLCIALRIVDKKVLKHFGRRLLMEAFLKVPNADDKKKIEIIDDDDESAVQDDTSKPEQVECDKSAEAFKMPLVFEQPCSVILLETLICVAGRKLFTQLYSMLFVSRCARLALERQTNFAVQRLLEYLRERSDFEQVFEELVPQLEELLKVGHTAVVAALGATCLRLGAKQAALLVGLQQALHTAGQDERAQLFFQCLVKLKPYEIVSAELNTNSSSTSYVNLHGSLLVQNALKFNKPIFLVNSLLNTPAAQLAAIFNTPNGSHIANAFMSSKFVGEKSRERFIRHLDGFYVDLAITKFGSRVMEACFEAALDAQKGYIVKQLADKTNMLRGSPFGRLIYAKFRIETYSLSAAQWRESFKSGKKTNKAQELFKDIIT